MNIIKAPRRRDHLKDCQNDSEMRLFMEAFCRATGLASIQIENKVGECKLGLDITKAGAVMLDIISLPPEFRTMKKLKITVQMEDLRLDHPSPENPHPRPEVLSISGEDLADK